MKTLQDIREDFMKQALEYDLGRSEEDFHSYLRHHNLEHHLSETQIIERNRENNKLNGLSMVMGIGVPLTLGAIFGLQKLTNNIIMGHGEHNFREPVIREQDRLTGRIRNIATDRTQSLTGFNTRHMPSPDAHISQSHENLLRTVSSSSGESDYYRGGSPLSPLNFPSVPREQEFFDYPAGYVPTQEEAVSNAVNIAREVLGANKNIGISPPTSLL